MEEIIYFSQLYVLIAFGFLLVDAFAVGFFKKTFNTSDIYESIFWPVTTFTILGIISRVIFEKIKGKK